MLSTSALSWAAARSGMTFSDFIASLTPEREEQLQRAYNAWRESKGLPPVQAVEPAPPARVAPEKVVPEAEDELSTLISHVAGEVAQEALEEAEAIHKTLDEINQMVIEEVEVEPEAEEAAAPEEAAQAEAPSADDAPAPTLKSLLADLPKAPDEAYYARVLAAGDAASIRATVEASIEAKRRAHKSRTALQALLDWMDAR